MIAMEAAASWEQFPVSVFFTCYKCTYLWSFCASPFPNENEICLFSLHWYIVRVCVRMWGAAQDNVSEISLSLIPDG